MSDASSGGGRVGSASRTLQYAVLFERSPDPMLAVDGEGTPSVVAVNTAAREQLDLGPGEDSPRPRWDVEFAAAERDVLHAAAAGSVGRGTVERTTRDGRATFALEAIPAREAGLTGFLRYRDVTERRIRDQQLAVLRRVLRHDLRNDLTVVLGYARTLAETASDPEAREAARSIVESARELEAVAESAGRLEAVTASAAPTDLADLLADLRRELAPDLPAGVEIRRGTRTAAVDRRFGIALEECCRTLAEHGGATGIAVDVSVENSRVAVTVAADASLSEQQRCALEGRAETKLRHATGIAPWIARWAIRGAGGRLRVRQDAADSTDVVLSVPRLGREAATGPEPVEQGH